MNESILTSIKKLLGMTEDYTAFDPDIIMHINTVIMVLDQIGVDSKHGYCINGKEEMWSDFIGERTDIEAVKSYVYLKVRLLFDPPQSSAVMEAIKQQINELEFRINIIADQGEKEAENVSR